MKIDIPELNIKGYDIPEPEYLEPTPKNVMRDLFECRVTAEGEGIFNYKGEQWITDNRHLFALYYLATASGRLPVFTYQGNFISSDALSMYYMAGLHPTYPYTL